MNVLVFGAGQCGLEFVAKQRQSLNADVTITAFIDNDRLLHGQSFYGIPVLPPERIPETSFDKIVISVEDVAVICAISAQLVELGVPDDKVVILHLPPVKMQQLYPKMFKNRIAIVREYARFIYSNGIHGNVAECGVFRGEFAKYINTFFPDRTLYLFDSFQGFRDEDRQFENTVGSAAFLKSEYSSGPVFAGTSTILVKNQMPNPENCIIRKGYFPESAAGIDDQFCFVHLDMDLYAPMLAGLHFFWEKMVPHGVILLHDYANTFLHGVKDAVRVFENERGGSCLKVLCHDGSSVAIVKT